MRCPFCSHDQDKVVDSRSSKEGKAVRRRRECLRCKKRFTTYEYIEVYPLSVIKSDKRREPFDRQKLLNGIILACKKRPISMRKIEQIVDEIERQLEKKSKTEICSLEIGKLVMNELSLVDDVAYVRFASVYRKFADRDEFVSEVQDLKAKVSKQTLKSS